MGGMEKVSYRAVLNYLFQDKLDYRQKSRIPHWAAVRRPGSENGRRVMKMDTFTSVYVGDVEDRAKHSGRSQSGHPLRLWSYQILLFLWVFFSSCLVQFPCFELIP